MRRGRLSSARLAQAGFTSSTVALEGKEGFLYEYAEPAGGRGRVPSHHGLYGPRLGHLWQPGFTLKRWPSCSSTHRPVDAIMELIRINQLSAAEIESIRVGLGISALRELVTPDPADGEEAKFSVGFQIGLYLTDRANAQRIITGRLSGCGGAEHHPPHGAVPRTEVRRSAQRCRCGSGLRYHRCKDGRTFIKERAFPVGHLSDPIPDEELRKKFFICTAAKLTPGTGQGSGRCHHGSGTAGERPHTHGHDPLTVVYQKRDIPTGYPFCACRGRGSVVYSYQKKQTLKEAAAERR